MICDVHCHIIPGVDDGARNEDTTKRMLSIAAEEGMDVLIATPHFSCADDKTDAEELQIRFQKVRELWKSYGEEKELYIGNELFYSGEVVEALSQGRALTINGTRYVLVEFPVYAEFAYIQKAIQRLRYAGYIPVIAHVERYVYVQKRRLMQELINTGAYLQVNTSTVLGKHGFFTKLFVMNLLKSDMIHFIGTDAHGARERRPIMKECRELMEKKLGKAHTHRILEENPKKMLRGERLDG